jgi:hypothetical protein
MTVSEFFARAWKLANDKARELGYQSNTASPVSLRAGNARRPVYRVHSAHDTAKGSAFGHGYVARRHCKGARSALLLGDFFMRPKQQHENAI